LPPIRGRSAKKPDNRKGVLLVSFAQSLLTGAFCISVVFAVLLSLWGLIRLFSAVLTGLESAKGQKQQGMPVKE
jgi:hypothetical protein